RYVRRRVPWPDADDPERIDFLLDLSVRNGLKGWALIPTDDYAVNLASVYHDVLSKQYRLTVPSWEKLQWACDKRLPHKPRLPFPCHSEARNPPQAQQSRHP